MSDFVNVNIFCNDGRGGFTAECQSCPLGEINLTRSQAWELVFQLREWIDRLPCDRVSPVRDMVQPDYNG